MENTQLSYRIFWGVMPNIALSPFYPLPPSLSRHPPREGGIMRARRVTGITLCCRTEKNVILLHNICVSTIDYAIQSFPTIHYSLIVFSFPIAPQVRISSVRRTAYHQGVALHIIIAKTCNLRLMIYTFGGDIQPSADDIPLLQHAFAMDTPQSGAPARRRH